MTILKVAKLYLTDLELENLKRAASRSGYTVSAYLRQQLDLPELKQGAPQGNKNRVLKETLPAAKKTTKKKTKKITGST